jgi:hypothetical protein
MYWKYFRTVISLVISGLAIYLSLRYVELTQVIKSLSGTDLKYVWLALGSVATNTLLKAIRWQMLLGKRKFQVGFSQIMMSLLSGQMLNTLFPARFGDLSRAYFVGESGIGSFYVLGTVAFEKVLDLIAYTLLFVIFVLWFPLPNWVSRPLPISILISLGLLILIIIMVKQQGWLIKKFFRSIDRLPPDMKFKLKQYFLDVLSSINIIDRRSLLTKLVLITSLVWATAVLNNHLALFAFGISLPLTTSMLLLISLQIGISLSSIPGNIGIFEYTCILVLTFAGVSRELALSYRECA